MGPERIDPSQMSKRDQEMMGAQGEAETKEHQGMLDRRDQARERANELERDIGEAQGAHYETIVYRLMRRTDDDPELVNALNDYLSALDIESWFGNPEEPMVPGKQREIIDRLKRQTQLMRFGR